jgi:hypothetical protein
VTNRRRRDQPGDPLEEVGPLSVPCGVVEDRVLHRPRGGVTMGAGGWEVRVLR